ncbi:hypothetical protein DFH09DRAFT_69049 [Mycena vulgaris]|nr:hypothetical protein DFH09DRAFT_69049 [Mycena vulgaris]
MAVYYDEYGDYAPGPAAFDHPDFSYDPETGYSDAPAYDTFYGDAQYDPDEPQCYEPCEEYGFGHADCYPGDPQVLERAEYVETSYGDAECMEIAYGEPGYWEEYHRRRYEIIHGLDFEEGAESPYVSENDGDVGGADLSEGLYDEVAVEAADVDAEAAGLLADEVEAWEVMWERGPRVGQNELAWAEEMEEWRQRLEMGADHEEGDTDDPDQGPILPTSFLDAPAVSFPADVAHNVAVPPTLEELQAMWDHGEIPEEDRAECARLLGELWVCELEDQRLLTAGYSWDEETGEYVHPDETYSSSNCDDDEDDLPVEYVDIHPTCDVRHLAEIAPPTPVATLSKIHVPPTYIRRPEVPESLKRTRPLRRTKFSGPTIVSPCTHSTSKQVVPSTDSATTLAAAA